MLRSPHRELIRVSLVLAALGFGALSLSAQEEAGKSGKAGDCVTWRGNASFASVGYDHIVTLKSACKKPMSCTVRMPLRTSMEARSVAPVKSSAMQPNSSILFPPAVQPE